MTEAVARTCTKCGRTHHRKGNSWCHGCNATYGAAWRKNNPNAHKTYLLERVYGLSLAEYRDQLAAQGGLCGICKQPERSIDKRTGQPYELAVDHCHQTGQLRGLLCHYCNRGLGNFRDDQKALRAAADYLAAGGC